MHDVSCVMTVGHARVVARREEGDFLPFGFFLGEAHFLLPGIASRVPPTRIRLPAAERSQF